MASKAGMAYLLPGVSVCQPTHLEGNGEFATEILPGPPSLATVQQAVNKRDPRKPSALYSYLPPSDPGSTYSGVMHGTLVVQDPAAKRSGVGRGAAGRAQRASARQQNGSTTNGEPLANNEAAGPSFTQSAATDGDVIMVDHEPTPSRSNSVPNNGDKTTSAPNGRSARKGKGKEREVEPSAVRVKEEPTAISLETPEPQTHSIQNDDHCSSCRSIGALIYCDGCPRAFHFWCVNPPIEHGEVGDNKWYCQACAHRMRPARRTTSTFVAPLIKVLDSTNPTEFQLPDDIRHFFKDVGTGDRGAYVDSSLMKPPRLNRHGQPEDRDAHRLKDRNGLPVLCYRCGTSSLPEGVAAEAPAAKRARKATAKAAQYEVWKNIISCDYCDLHWHLDCLDPPLSSMPSFAKKWMCPNHSDKTLMPKKRIPKQTIPPIEIAKPRQFNNGNIDVIPESGSRTQIKPKHSVDEVLINGRRYRVPERVILLDFWNKVGNKHDSGSEDPQASGTSSPLTSLSSLDDEVNDSMSLETQDYQVAQMLCNLRLGAVFPLKKLKDASVQTEPSLSITLPSQGRGSIASSKVARVIAPPKLKTSLPRSVASSSTPVSSTASTSRRKSGANTPDTSDRDLRSNPRTSWKDAAMGEDDVYSSLSSLSSSSTATDRAKFRVKVEDSDTILENGDDPMNSTPRARGRSRKQTSKAQSQWTTEDDDMDLMVPTKEKRGKKRKSMDDDSYHHAAVDRALKEPRGAEPRTKRTQNNPTSPPTSTTTAPASLSTPSLKIRLPAHRPLQTSPSHAASEAYRS